MPAPRSSRAAPSRERMRSEHRRPGGSPLSVRRLGYDRDRCSKGPRPRASVDRRPRKHGPGRSGGCTRTRWGPRNSQMVAKINATEARAGRPSTCDAGCVPAVFILHGWYPHHVPHFTKRYDVDLDATEQQVKQRLEKFSRVGSCGRAYARPVAVITVVVQKSKRRDTFYGARCSKHREPAAHRAVPHPSARLFPFPWQSPCNAILSV